MSQGVYQSVYKGDLLFQLCDMTLMPHTLMPTVHTRWQCRVCPWRRLPKQTDIIQFGNTY